MKATDSKKTKTIGIASTSSPIDPSVFQKAIANLHALGFQVRVPLDPSKGWGRKDFGFCSDTPENRASAFMALVEDPEVAAIVSARGGYGTIDVLPLLDFEVIRKVRKPIIGFSDFTVLLVAAWVKAKASVIHGPSVLSAFANYHEDQNSYQNAQAVLRVLNNAPEVQETCEVIRGGNAKGPLLVGNLTMLTTLIATPWDVPYDGSVLVLEDTGEAPYRVHRALNQLRYAGKLRSLAGLIFGRFSKSDPRTGPTVEEILRDTVNGILKDTDFPVLMGFPVGHDGLNVPLPLGAEIAITGDQVRL